MCDNPLKHDLRPSWPLQSTLHEIPHASHLIVMWVALPCRYNKLHLCPSPKCTLCEGRFIFGPMAMMNYTHDDLQATVPLLAIVC